MARSARWIALACLIACGGAPDRRRPASNIAPNERRRITDDAFRRDALDVARRTQRRVYAWGEIAFEPIGGHYATLDATDDRSDATAVYLLEADGAYFLVTVLGGGRGPRLTQLWGANGGTRTPSGEYEPTFAQRSEHALTHAQAYDGSEESADVAIFDGSVVLLRLTRGSETRAHRCPSCARLVVGRAPAFVQAVRGPAPTISELLR